MQSRNQSNWLRYSRNFCTSTVLSLVTLFSCLPPVTVDSNFAKANAASPENQQKSAPRWIEIDLSEQRLIAWEGKKRIYSYRISTGKRTTPTPKGKFWINSKYRTHRMRGQDYDIPDVPYAMYFYGGYAIHGAYWHNKFGTPVSHGCVNLRVKQARQLYNWAKIGTLVVVHK
ncbi:L,D-transpeptidase [Calothrix sp. FACHB-1219]|uniref:L,D-transpeptidase n=1 Tax=unclassified Calothrix TaxID=2619626 RepID=UPI0016854DC1|nr:MULTISPECIES: L,D-transpeptidase [unclassified Calothrix]MBD2206254.1 L,D-transpeptidase [Calothrix sp. FACHB-168]MBD2219150.1 L,D-transpeptidase [Calothrix sp. FACHB-1219]